MNVVGILQQKEQIVIVDGKGEDKKAAFANALNSIQKQILKESSNVLLRIEPKNVEVLVATEKKEIERFLFIFFPRERKSYSVQLKVTVDISFLPIEQITFSSEKSPDTNRLKQSLDQLFKLEKKGM